MGREIPLIPSVSNLTTTLTRRTGQVASGSQVLDVLYLCCLANSDCPEHWM